jgi:hypothetical protein
VDLAARKADYVVSVGADLSAGFCPAATLVDSSKSLRIVEAIIVDMLAFKGKSSFAELQKLS